MFDICIMNPPYSNTLHLQIVEKVLKVCDKVVNISPVGWLLDMTVVLSLKKTTYHRFENTISRHIASLSLLTGSEASVIFGAGFFQNVGFKNWHESCNTKFMKYCNFLTRNGQHLAAHLLPFMDDYSHEWTDKLFYDYFRLTKDEVDIIEQFGKPYIYCDTRK